RVGAPAHEPAPAGKFSHSSGASSACVRCRGGGVAPAHAVRPYAWRATYVKRAMRVWAGAVSLLVWPLQQRREQTDRFKRSRQLVSAAGACAGGTSTSHLSANVDFGLLPQIVSNL